MSESEMRSSYCGSLAAFLVGFGIAGPSVAQTASGPATLENLLNADGLTDAPAVAEQVISGASSRRPPGTVARPKNGVQHPDLDKAWAYYETAVGRSSEAVREWISQQFNAAAAKGDLDNAERWQNALEKFEQSGEVPDAGDAKPVVSRALADYRKARDELANSYENVVKALTMEKKIAEARVARDELRGLIDDLEHSHVGEGTSAEPTKQRQKSQKSWPPLGSYMYSQSGGWKASITIEEGGVSRCQGRIGKWAMVDANAMRITFWNGKWIEVRQGSETGTLAAYRTHDGQTGVMRPEHVGHE